jgi:hypothetical protein
LAGGSAAPRPSFGGEVESRFDIFTDWNRAKSQ